MIATGPGTVAYLVMPDLDGNTDDPRWFVKVRVVDVVGPRVTYRTVGGATGFQASADVGSFVPVSALKRTTVNGRHRLVWR